MHLNDDSDKSTIFDYSSINDSENSKNCESTPSSNVQGNEAEICESGLKCKFVSKIDITLPRWVLIENEISLLWKGYHQFVTRKM